MKFNAFYHVLLSSMLLSLALGHSFLTNPMPISHTETCRIGGNPGFEAHCTGPCPNPKYRPRGDMLPENPSATYMRGEWYDIHYSKNNHQGGFVRLTLVPLDEMYVKSVHDIMAFYYGCWSSHQGYECNEFEHHRDCGFDRDNLAWKVSVRIPTVYPDGVYVLGWSWYGGGETFGSFGDYYDCSFVRIQGGPLNAAEQAVFQPGPMYEHGCQSSVDRLGICTTEPCSKDYWSREMIPAEFHGGTPMIYRDWYEQAQSRPSNQVQVMEPDNFGVLGFALYDTGNERLLDVNLTQFVDLTGIRGITIIPKYFGSVERIEWVVNGEKGWDQWEYPFSIGGQQVTDNHHGSDHEKIYNFYDWPYPLFDKRIFVTAISHSNGLRHYYSQDLYFKTNTKA